MSKAENTRDSILAVAKQLFTTHGFSEVSLSMIAKEVGITKAALYHFFENKAAIYVTVVEDVSLAITEAFDAALASSPEETSLADVIEHVIAVAMKEGNVMLRMGKCPIPKDRERMHEDFKMFFQKVGSVLAHYQVREPKLATHVFLNAVHGYIRWAHVDEDATDVRTYSEYLATLFQQS